MAKDNSLVIALIGIVVMAFVVGIAYNAKQVDTLGFGAGSTSSNTICKDTDGGKIYLVAGNTTLGKTTSKDVCLDSTRLREFYCDKNRIDYVPYNCALQNKVCKNGACVACVDSDGKNFYTKGYIKYLGSTSWDKCYDPNSGQTVNKSNWLAEMYCTDDGQAGGQTQTPCANGCVNGACVKGDCDVEDILTYGSYATKTYTVNGFDYEITLIMVDAYKNTAKFSVNGVVTNEIAVGASFFQGFKIRVASITPDGRGGYTVIFCFKAETTQPPTPLYSCPAGGIVDTLKDGETKTYTMNGMDYEITGVFIDSFHHTAKFAVNGQVTSALAVGQSQVIWEEKITLLENMVNQREGLATFCLAPTTELPPLEICPAIDDSFFKDGETKTFTVNGKDYEITAVLISAGQDTAKFSVNGVLTKDLGVGVSDNIGPVSMRVLELMANEREGLVRLCLTFTSSTCGDGIIQTGEQCEGNMTLDCGYVNRAFTRGTATCTNCMYDTTKCTGVTVGWCGDGVVQIGEQCDSSVAPVDCFILGFSNMGNGTLTCNKATCKYDTSKCTIPRCGNGIRDSVFEQCDGTDLNGNICMYLNQGFIGGTLRCKPDCKFDTSGCISPKCVNINNILEPGEQCDGSIYPALSCGKFGFTASVGSLSCWSNCLINTTRCVGVTGGFCGDNIVELGEQCDNGPNGGTAASLNCADFGYAGGTLTCNPLICKYDTSKCTVRDNVTISVSAMLDGAEWRGPVIFDLSSRADFNGVFVGGLIQVPKVFSYPPPNTPIVTYIQYRQMEGYQSGPTGAYLGTIESSCGQTGNPTAGPCNAPASFVFKFKTASFCGDNLIQQPNGAGFNEQCDGTNLNGKMCTDYGYVSGTLACTSDCTYDFSGCAGPLPVCGDGVKNSDAEACDGADLNGRTCTTFGNFTGGTLRCTSTCNYDFGACKMGPCTDSDGGQNFNVKGYVTYDGYVSSNGELIKEWDACSGSILQEKYCSVSGTSYGIGLISHVCPNGCSDGACI
jgi:hypothetical protein